MNETVQAASCAIPKTQNPKLLSRLIDFISQRNIMENIINCVHIGNYVAMATLCSFCLLFSSRSGLGLLYPEGVLAFEQGALLAAGRPFPGRLDSPEPGLPWGARSNFRLASFGRGFRSGMVLPSQARSLDKDVLFQRRASYPDGGRRPDHNLPWDRSNPAGS